MAEAAKALGKAGPISFRGRDYPLKPFDYDGIAWFELQLEARAWDSVERTRHLVSQDTYSRRLETMAKLIAAGHFAFGSQAAAEAARTVWGQKQILYWMMSSADNPDVSEKLIEDIFAENLASVQALMNEANADPNGQAPITAPGTV